MRQIFFIRHAVAMDQRDFKKMKKKSQTDLDRPLTKAGSKKFRQFLRLHAGIFPSSISVFTSPAIRTLDTAKLVKQQSRKSKIKKVDILQPDQSVNKQLRWLKKAIRSTSGPVAVVGHAPEINQLSSRFCHSHEDLFSLEKGACLVVETSGKGRTIRWLGEPE